eukprot:62654-Lingulodinium_polyedra.AAC.1
MFQHVPTNLGNLGNLEHSSTLGTSNLGMAWNLGFGKVPGHSPRRGTQPPTPPSTTQTHPHNQL